MAGDTVITIIGNLTADPELRFTPSGAAVANFTVASTPRMFDRQSNEWKDGETLFMRCSVWRDAAENVAESLQRGMRVIVSGRLISVLRDEGRREAHRRRAGRRRDRPSLRNATAKVSKTQRGGGGGFGGGQQGGGWSGGGQQQGGDDPWATGPGGGQGGPRADSRAVSRVAGDSRPARPKAVLKVVSRLVGAGCPELRRAAVLIHAAPPPGSRYSAAPGSGGITSNGRGRITFVAEPAQRHTTH